MVIYAQDIMRRVNNTVQGNLTARQAAKLMANDQTGFLIVKLDNGRSGIITEWDIMSKVVALDLDPNKVLRNPKH